MANTTMTTKSNHKYPRPEDITIDGDKYALPFGKHKGKVLNEVPAAYLIWCCEQPWFIDGFEDLKEWIEENFEEIEVRMKDEREEHFRGRGR